MTFTPATESSKEMANHFRNIASTEPAWSSSIIQHEGVEIKVERSAVTGENAKFFAVRFANIARRAKEMGENQITMW